MINIHKSQAISRTPGKSRNCSNTHRSDLYKLETVKVQNNISGNTCVGNLKVHIL